MWQLFTVTFFDWWEIQFDQVWSSLIHFGQIWSKKIKNKPAIFILSLNVTTFYCNIFRLLRKSNLIKFDQVWSILDRSYPKKSKTKQPFLSFLKNVTTLYTNIFWYLHPLKSFVFAERQRQKDGNTDIIAQIVV